MTDYESKEKNDAVHVIRIYMHRGNAGLLHINPQVMIGKQ